MLKLIKGEKACPHCGSIFTFENEDYYSTGFYLNEQYKVTYDKVLKCPVCSGELKEPGKIQWFDANDNVIGETEYFRGGSVDL